MLCDSNYNIKQLPSGLLVSILGLLGNAGAGNRARVCRNFASAQSLAITKLKVTPNMLADNCAGLLKALKHFPNTTVCDFSCLDIGDSGVQALASVLPKTLITLDFYGNQIKAAGARALAAKLPDTLTTLNLSGNQIKAAGAIALAEVLFKFKDFTSLDFGNNNIGSEAIALARVLPQTITTLNLYCNQIEDSGIQALAKHLPPKLTMIDLSDNLIKAAGAIVLAGVLPSTIKILNLGYNDIGDDGAVTLANKLHDCPNLTNLYLEYNSIGDKGAKTLANALHYCPNLTNLYLEDNDIGTVGVQDLVAAVASELFYNDSRQITVYGIDGFKDLVQADLKTFQYRSKCQR